jgi:hypothetical protein
VVVAVWLGLHQHRPIDPFVPHPLKIFGQRVAGKLRLVGQVDRLRVPGVAPQVAAEHMGVPLDDHRGLLAQAWNC